MFGEADADDLVATWAEGLGRYDAADLKRALDTMLNAYPDYPPTLPQFAAMCRDAMRARMQDVKPLVVRYGGPSPEVLAEIHKISSLHANRKKDPRDWARRLVKRELDGEVVNDYALRCAKEVLGMGQRDEE